ncbi:Gfo/Idh/MocA family oxidoreductase [Gluconobacter kanchanaburiensis]|nr:Gfo/Idh/MocA family oxidoreductase [Gluconobacter kanchanaburiensis]
MVKRVTLGLIGAGEVAQLIHLPILHQLSDRFEVVSLYDPSPSVAQMVGAHWGVPHIHTDIESFFSDRVFDAVMVLSPDQYHAEHARMAFAAGLHVFLEKPACLTEAEFSLLNADFERADRVGMVGYMRCYAPAFQKARALLPEFGPIRHVRIRDVICEGPWFFGQVTPVVVPEGDIPADLLDSGRRARRDALLSVCGADASPSLLRGYEVLTGLGIHAFSAMRVLLGSPVRVIAAHFGATGTEISIWFDYGNFIASYECLIDDVARFESSIEILSNTQSLKVRYDTPYIRNLPAGVTFQETVGAGNRVTEYGPYYQDPFNAELIAFYDAVVAGVAPVDRFSNALADLTLCRQIIEAAKTTMSPA